MMMKTNLPFHEAAEMVVCRICGQVVCTQPGDRVLWRPEDAALFLWQPCSSCDARAAGDHLNPPRQYADSRQTPVARRAANAAGRMPRAPKQLSMRRRISEWLDNEPTQFALILAAGILPLALAIFLPRAMYRVSARDRQRIASRDPTSANDSLAKTVDQSPPEVRPIAKREVAPVPEPVVELSQVAPTAKMQPTPPDTDALFRPGKRRGVKGELASSDDFGAVRRDRPERAWRYYDRAGVWYTRAMVHQRMGRLTEAVADMWRAVERSDGDAAGGDRAFARRLRNKADELTNELFEQATALIRAGRYEAAIAGFTEVLTHRPDCASAWLRRGLAYDQNMQDEKALADLNIALELRPGPAQAFKLRSVLHERNGNHAAALADMLAACRLDPTNREYADRATGLRLRQQTREWQRRQYARR